MIHRKKKIFFVVIFFLFIFLMMPINYCKASEDILNKFQYLQPDGNNLTGTFEISSKTKIEIYVNENYEIGMAGISMYIGDSAIYINSDGTPVVTSAQDVPIEVEYSGRIEITEYGLFCYVYYITTYYPTTYMDTSNISVQMSVKYNDTLLKMAVVTAKDIGEDRTTASITKPIAINLGYLSSNAGDAAFFNNLTQIVNAYAVTGADIEPYNPEPKPKTNPLPALILFGFVILLLVGIIITILTIRKNKKAEQKEKEEFLKEKEEETNLKKTEEGNELESYLNEIETKDLTNLKTTDKKEEINERDTENEIKQDTKKEERADGEKLYEKYNQIFDQNQINYEKTDYAKETNAEVITPQIKKVPKFATDIENVPQLNVETIKQQPKQRPKFLD